MEAKGIFFVGRKQQVVGRLGVAPWDRFVERLGTLDELYRQPILPATRVPMPSYFLFQEESLREFHGGDEQAYWQIGESTGEWALREGPYRHYLDKRHEIGEFVERILPQIWTNYFTEGELQTRVSGKIIEGAIVGIPVSHVSLEYSVMGFMRRAIALVGFPAVSQTRVAGLGIRYRFSV